MNEGLFSSDVNVTGVENAGDPSANTYCIIGLVDSDKYRFDEGYYWLRLIYRYDDGTSDELEWSQTSWITESTITGAELFGVSDDSDFADTRRFKGLGLSSKSNTYLDGNGDLYSNWWHAVAVSTGFNTALGYGIPGVLNSHCFASFFVSQHQGSCG